MLKSGCRWYGPPTTIYNRFVRWAARKQAVGRSRGGRNTKIHALADAKGRLLAVLLTGGQAHDCPVAERLIRRVNPSKRLLGDKGYDRAEFREELHERGTKPVIPNRCNRKQPFGLEYQHEGSCRAGEYA